MFYIIKYLRITYNFSVVFHCILFSRLFDIKCKLFPNFKFIIKVSDVSILGWGLLPGPPWAPECACAQAPFFKWYSLHTMLSHRP